MERRCPNPPLWATSLFALPEPSPNCFRRTLTPQSHPTCPLDQQTSHTQHRPTYFSIPATLEYPELKFSIGDSRVQAVDIPGGVRLTGIRAEDLHLAHFSASTFANVHTFGGKVLEENLEMPCSVAQFGPSLKQANIQNVTLLWAKGTACSPLLSLHKLLQQVRNTFARPVALLISRGSCPFQRKVEHAQAIGAMAVIIGNTDSAGVIQMAADIDSTNASLVTIPSVMVTKLQSEKLVEYIMNGKIVTVRIGAAGDAAFAQLGLKVTTDATGAVLLTRPTLVQNEDSTLLSDLTESHNLDDDSIGNQLVVEEEPAP